MSNKKALAASAYRQVCAALDERNWKYDKDDEKMQVFFSVSGDDLPMKMAIIIDENRQLIRLLSPLPFQISEDKRVVCAIAACVASNHMINGSFDFDISTGNLLFRLVNTFQDSLIGTALVQYMVSCACATVDRYNDKFLALSKGMMTLEEFIASDRQA